MKDYTEMSKEELIELLKAKDGSQKVDPDKVIIREPVMLKENESYPGESKEFPNNQMLSILLVIIIMVLFIIGAFYVGR